MCFILLCSFTAFQTFDCCSILFRLTLNDDHVVFWAAKNLWGVDVLREHHEQHDEGDHGEEDHGHVVSGGRLQHQVASIVHMWRRRWGYCRDCNNILKDIAHVCFQIRILFLQKRPLSSFLFPKSGHTITFWEDNKRLPVYNCTSTL